MLHKAVKMLGVHSFLDCFGGQVVLTFLLSSLPKNHLSKIFTLRLLLLRIVLFR